MVCVAWLLALADSAHAQSFELPRQLPAVVAFPTHNSVGPPVLTVQAIEPIADSFASGSTIEEIAAPQPAAGGEIIYEGTPDMFPGGNRPMMVEGDGMADITVEYNEADLNLPACGGCGQCQSCAQCGDCRMWQVLPSGIIYHSYLAGPKEPRLAAVFFDDKDLGWQLDYTVGARVGLLRYGTTDNIWPQGFQIDVEGAAFPRVNLEESMDLDAVDYRVGIPFTYGKDKWQAKLAVYHLSAHVGDEYLIRHPNFERINYVRDAIVLGGSVYPVDFLRLYGEVEFAFHTDGGAEPWAFQFGTELSPLRYNGCGGDPFLAMNVSLREDVDFGGNFTLQTGWQWRGFNNRRLLRTGFHLLTGKSNQYEFFRRNETQLGIGVWYDF